MPYSVTAIGSSLFTDAMVGYPRYTDLATLKRNFFNGISTSIALTTNRTAAVFSTAPYAPGFTNSADRNGPNAKAQIWIAAAIAVNRPVRSNAATARSQAAPPSYQRR